MNVALNLVPSAVGQTRPQIISAIVAKNTTETPLPTSFADPLYVVSPTDSDSWWKVTDWPASRGVTLPQAGAAVALFYDVKGVLRCMWWDGIYEADPITAPPRAVSNNLSGTMVASTVVTVTTASWSLQNGMTTSGNGVKVPIAGYYRFDAQVTGPSSSASGGIYQLAFSINGGTAAPVGTGTTGIPTATAFPTVTAFDEVHMSAGDVVTLVTLGSLGDSIHDGVFIVRYTGQ